MLAKLWASTQRDTYFLWASGYPLFSFKAVFEKVKLAKVARWTAGNSKD